MMKKVHAHNVSRRWEDMEVNILLKIFQSLDILELTSGVAQVCHSWRLAACDPILWKELDLSMLKSNVIKIPIKPYVSVDSQSNKTLMRVLKISLNRSKGCVLTLTFNSILYIDDYQLTYIADRCPRLKNLVMPGWNRIKKTGICKAISMWPELESLTMPSIIDSPPIMRQIGKSCKNFSQLQVMGIFDQCFASSIAAYLPNLKVLSLTSSKIWRDALITILDELKNLEVLNISHSLLVVMPPSQCYAKELDEIIMEKASRLREFLYCMDDSCEMCQRTRCNEGRITWYRYKDGVWMGDHVLGWFPLPIPDVLLR